jgi:ribonuclease VapC
VIDPKIGVFQHNPSARGVQLAHSVVMAFLAANNVKEMLVGADIGRRALDAAARFGRVVGHPANLNLGDCFVYACAKAYRVPLLFKGEDFSQTDIND